MPASDRDSPAPTVAWTAWPATEAPARTVLVVVAILAFSSLAGLLGGDLLWAATAATLMALGLNRWFLPSRYEVDDDGVVAGFPLRRRSLRWSDARLLVLDPKGGWLSGGRRGRAARRGIDLYWGGDPARTMSDLGGVARRAVENGSELEIVEPPRAAGEGAAT